MPKSKDVIRDHVQRLIEHILSVELAYTEYERVHIELLRRIR